VPSQEPLRTTCGILSGMQDELPAKPEVAEWMDCSGTAYVNDPAAELPIDQGLRFDLPQFTSPGLDPSSLAELRGILLGRTMIELAQDFQNGVVWENPVRRIAYAVPIPHEHSVQLYVCSDELCKMLAALDEQRANDVVRRWGIPSPHPEGGGLESRYRLRVRVLQQLAALSRIADSTGKKLMLRVEYRRQIGDAGTARVRRNDGTRH
jgi:hypothetical protein